MVIDINTVVEILIFHEPGVPVKQWDIMVFSDDGPILENMEGQPEQMLRCQFFQGIHASHVCHAAHLDPRFHHDKVRAEYVRKDYYQRIKKARAACKRNKHQK